MKVLEPKSINSGGNVREEILTVLRIGNWMGHRAGAPHSPRPLKVLAILASDRPSSLHFIV